METPGKTRKIIWTPAVSQGDRHCNRLRIPADRQPFGSAHQVHELLINVQFLEGERQQSLRPTEILRSHCKAVKSPDAAPKSPTMELPALSESARQPLRSSVPFHASSCKRDVSRKHMCHRPTFSETVVGQGLVHVDESIGLRHRDTESRCP